MTDVNATVIPFIEPVATIMNTLKVLVGGVFGLYVILFFIKVREYFVVKNTLKKIQADIVELTSKVDALSKKGVKRKK